MKRTVDELNEHIGASMCRLEPDLILVNGKIVNTITGEIYYADIAIKDNVIVRVGDISDILEKYPTVSKIDCSNSVLVPGFIDTHLHTESTFLTPSQFASVALPRGTTTVVVDPHEIANVLGIRGLDLYVKEANSQLLEFLVEMPSCVPAAESLETGINPISSDQYDPLLSENRFFALAEMMNFPGVIYGDPEVLNKISIAQSKEILVEGHAPGLSGKELQAYITAGVSSCHESFTADEAIEKLRLGMKVQLREGSFAKNLLVLANGIKQKLQDAKNPWNNVIIASDDRHADELLDLGHIDHSLRLLVNDVGLDPITALQICTINPANHLKRDDLGVIAPGKMANIVRLNNLSEFKVLDVISKGKHVASNNKILYDITIPSYPKWALNTVKPKYIPTVDDFTIHVPKDVNKVHVIEVMEHSLITGHLIEQISSTDGKLNLNNDLAFFFLLDRYGVTNHFSKSVVKGFKFEGNVGIASTVAHDSHQLLICGNDAESMYHAMKLLIDNQGGQCIVTRNNGSFESRVLPLPYAGLMSLNSPEEIAKIMRDMKQFTSKVVKGISEPFMALSFMALPVIPQLKLTDKGLVDVDKFELINLFIK